MRRLKMLGIGVVVCLLLEMTFAFSIIGKQPTHDLILTRAKRSPAATQPPLTCNKAEVDNLIKDTKETCSRITSVDTYITNLNSKQPISVPSFNDLHGFKTILTHYNNDLQTSKNNCQPWRNADSSIFSSIQRVVEASKDFEPNFKTQFQHNQQTLKHILENHQDIAQMEATIAKLTQEITEAKQAAKLDSTPTIQSHLDNVIKTKQQEIDNIINDHNILQAKRELDQLIQFLEWVRNHTSDIKAKGDTARTKINAFRDNISKDSTAFNRHRKHAQEGINNLNQEKNNNNQQLANIQTQKDNLNKHIATERAQINTLNAQIAQAHNDIRDVENRIAKSMRRTRRKKRIGRFLSFAGGWVVGSILSHSARRDLDRLANQKRALINDNTRRIQTLQAQIAKGNQQIATYQNIINDHQSKARQLQQQLDYFNNLDANLHSLQTEVDTILPKIADAITGVSHVRDTFEKISHHLQDTIDKAKVSKTQAQVRNIKHFIYNEIDQLKCKWEKANENILPLAQCQ